MILFSNFRILFEYYITYWIEGFDRPFENSTNDIIKLYIYETKKLSDTNFLKAYYTCEDPLNL